MKKIFFVAAFFIFSCGKINNSSSDDIATYSPPFVASGAFGNVQQILIQHCTFCHSEWTQYTQDSFITAGLVTPGNITTSKLYFRNINSTVTGTGAKDMPNNASPAISLANLQIMADWINSL